SVRACLAARVQTKPKWPVGRSDLQVRALLCSNPQSSAVTKKARELGTEQPPDQQEGEKARLHLPHAPPDSQTRGKAPSPRLSEKDALESQKGQSRQSSQRP